MERFSVDRRGSCAGLLVLIGRLGIEMADAAGGRREGGASMAGSL